MFQPVIPNAGLAGWRFLQQTYDRQFETFTKSVELNRDTEYFLENVSEIRTAEDFVADRRIMTVALGAFGLEDDINNSFFIRKILEEGTTDDAALANRFSDKRYSELSEAFGFGPGEFIKTGEAGFADAIVARFEAASFEIAAGEQNPAMRVALYAQRDLDNVARLNMSNDAKWFNIMGDAPMRQLFEKALGLPSAIGQIDIDQQLGLFKDRASRLFGSDDVSQFADKDLQQELITRFVVRDQVDSFTSNTSSASIALTLLQSY